LFNRAEQAVFLTSSSLGLIEVNATLARKQRAGEVNAVEFGRNKALLLKDWRHF